MQRRGDTLFRTLAMSLPLQFLRCRWRAEADFYRPQTQQPTPYRQSHVGPAYPCRHGQHTRRAEQQSDSALERLEFAAFRTAALGKPDQIVPAVERQHTQSETGQRAALRIDWEC